MKKSDFVQLEDFLNQVCFDLDIYELECSDSEQIKRVQFCKSHLTKAIVYMAPLTLNAKEN